MKIKKITDIDAFFKTIDSCSGKVELVTSEGDRLNLKSKLSQYVSFVNFLSISELIDIELIAEDKNDIAKLLGFIVKG